MRAGGPRRPGGVLCVALAAMLAAGCSDSTREAIGLQRTPPDEFAVLTRAPLTVPPDYGLRPPQPGTPRPQENRVKDEARDILVRSARGGDQSVAGQRTTGESALLDRAGAGAADSGIRNEVDRESAQIAEGERSFVDKLIFWREPEPPGEVVDATKEAQRLRGNAALGEPPTSGATPVIERRERGFLEGILN